MRTVNQTKDSGCILVGLGASQNFLFLTFTIFLLLYIATLFVNIITIALFVGSRHLHSPMYFFLAQLSLCDILLSTNVLPALLCALLRGGLAMSTSGCITQFYSCCSVAAAECFILAVMSFDRYVAICNPLRYICIMNIRLSVHLVISSWFSGLLFCLIFAIMTSRLYFCGFIVINYTYCDFAPLIEVSCSDTTDVERLAIVVTLPVAIFPFLFIILTYIRIFVSILQTSNSSARHKSFSTCSSHLSVVCTFYSIIIAKYAVPTNGQSLNRSKVISLLYTVVTPLLNPIIYSLRNTEIRKAFIKIISNSMGK
ncbi:hypothetical protein GDO86_018428 [Hymenochirus boettgeri]|uniref:Olfactory receptor n=1 Tax=Hymenochirus boettgeri TaxID=247094 RepID=A0A8T2IIZ9_9PIPI|nr:hypothetical protein GDO86_018428 [Hymenochirus boettgeri]